MEVRRLSWHRSKLLAGDIRQRNRWLIWTIFMLKIRCTWYSHARNRRPIPVLETLLHSINQQHICNPTIISIFFASFTVFCSFLCACEKLGHVVLSVFLTYGEDSQSKHDSVPGGAVTRQHLQHLIHIHPHFEGDRSGSLTVSDSNRRKIQSWS